MSIFSDPRARRNIITLVLAQALIGAQMPMIFTMGGLAGQSLAENPCLATLPISLIMFGSMLAANPLASLMHRYGRQTGFWIGVACGGIGSALAAYGLYTRQFSFLIVGSLITGVYMSAQGFYRFAATDTTPLEHQPTAISYVMAGGLAAAIIGPQLMKLTSDLFVTPFLGSYLVIVGINILGAFLISRIDIPKPVAPQGQTLTPRPYRELLKSGPIRVAMICAMVSFALMSLVMTSAPLAVVGCGYGRHAAADIVSAHVLAMYIPSFFTGHLITRFGVIPIISLGLLILAGAGGVALSGVELSQFFIAMVMLGIGWNFGFIGATTLLTQLHEARDKERVQGLNDFVVFGGVTLASLASGGLMNCSGGSVLAGWSAVNIAMLPFLALAALALVWLKVSTGRSAK